MRRIVHLVPEWPTKYQTFVQDDIEISQAISNIVCIFEFSTSESGLRNILFWIRRTYAMMLGFTRLCKFRLHRTDISPWKLSIKQRVRLCVLIGKMPWLLTEPLVVHAHFLAHTAEIGAYLGILNDRIVTIATAHGSEVLMNATPALIEVAKRFDFIVGASHAVLADLNRKSVLCNSNITSSQYVRYCRTHENVPRSDEILAVPTFENDTWRFLSVGRMHPQKGWDICIKLALELKNKSIKFKWTFIGDGYEFQRIRNLVYDQGLQNEISLLGRKPRNFCLEMMRMSDFTVLPSVITGKDCDGLPLVILEAMRAGSIVISTKVAGIPEAIGEGRGLLLNESVEESVQQIVSLMKDSDGMKNISRSANLWVAQNTSIDISDPLLEVYGCAFRKLADTN